MENFETTISIFLTLLKQYSGKAPIFQIDYTKEVIILKNAPSGFLKVLYLSDKVLASLHEEGLYIEYFRKN